MDRCGRKFQHLHPPTQAPEQHCYYQQQSLLLSASSCVSLWLWQVDLSEDTMRSWCQRQTPSPRKVPRSRSWSLDGFSMAKITCWNIKNDDKKKSFIRETFLKKWIVVVTTSPMVVTISWILQISWQIGLPTEATEKKQLRAIVATTAPHNS